VERIQPFTSRSLVSVEHAGLNRSMTGRELRKQRREAERKTRKLAYQQSRNVLSASAGAPESSFTPNPELFDEFNAEEQAEMIAIRARVHARAGIASSQQPIGAPEPSDEPAPLSEAKIQTDEPALLSEAKIQERSGPAGPRTANGKAISSGNSLKHGLASGRVIIPGEDPAEFEALLNDLNAEHVPATPTEQMLVQQMAQSWWLMQRAIRIQNEAFAETRCDSHKLALFLRYQTTYERAFYRALNSLMKLQKERRKTPQEFVSQTSVRAMHASPASPKHDAGPDFVSQPPHVSAPEPDFVSQNSVERDTLHRSSATE
jgi:hypothetical protein